MERSLKFGIFILTISIVVGVGNSSQTVAATPASSRPNVVVVLSGGGARGAAHIGVLRVLEEMHVVPDLIIGTSMGSIVGGLYAAGWSPDEIEKLLVSIDWNEVFTARVPRRDLSYRRKQDDRPFLIKASVHFDKGGVHLPSGLVSSQSLEVLLQTLEAESKPPRNFNQFPIPYRAVATDLETGDPVVISSGSLATAMRASMSIPGLFAPVVRDGKTLVDGGAAANLPVGIAQAMGARTIIAVDISTPLRSPDLKLKNFWDVYARLSSFLIVRNRVEDTQRLAPGDILIRPDLEDIGFLDFDQATDAVALGEKAARSAEIRLRSLAASPSRWREFLDHHRCHPIDTLHVDRVRLESSGWIQEGVVLKALDLASPADVSREDLRKAIMRLYHLGNLGNISFRVDTVAGLQELVVNAPPPDHGRNSIQVGLNLVDDFKGNGVYTATIRHRLLPANRGQGEWTNFLSLGSRAALFSEFYQPLDAGLRWFVAPSIGFRREDLDVWLDGEPFVTYNYDRREVRIGIGRVLGNQGEIRLSPFFSKNSLRREVGLPVFPNASEDRAGLELTVTRDTEDSITFPTAGGRFRFSLTETLDEFGSDYENRQVHLAASQAWTLGAFTIQPYLEYGENRNATISFADIFFLGGPGRLSGLGTRELYGDRLAFGRVQVYRRLKGLDLAGIRVRSYFGVSLEAGNVFNVDGPMSADAFLHGGTLYLGAETPMGPIYLGYGSIEGGRHRWYLAIGDHF